MATTEIELQHLDEFHSRVAEKDVPGQASAIRSGYMPEGEKALIEAGVRCIPFIFSGDPSLVDAGLDRMKAVVFKLKLVKGTSESISAIEKFEKIMEDQGKQADRETMYGLLMIGGLVIFITVVVFLIVRMFVK